MEKRKAPRYKRRVSLQFWSPRESGRRRIGFTVNVSETGIFVATNSPFSVGTLIVIELNQGEKALRLEGEVRSAIRVDPVLRKLKQSGMGVRLLSTAEKMRAIIEPTPVGDTSPPSDEKGEDSDSMSNNGESKNSPLYSVYFDSQRHLSSAFDSHIQHGGVFVPTAESSRLEELVRLEFLFHWAPKTLFQTMGTVVKTFPAPGTRPSQGGEAGLGVAFCDPQEAIAHFRQVLDISDEDGRAAAI